MTPVGRVELDGTAIEVVELPATRPDAGAIVLLHEALGSVSLWRGLPAAIAAATGERVVAYSRPGHGRSGPAPRPRTVDFFAREADETLPALLASLGIARPLLVGHSDGATIALLHAARHRVRGAVLIAPHVVVEEDARVGIERTTEAYERGGRLRGGLARHHDAPDALFEDWSRLWLGSEMDGWTVEADAASVTAPLLLVQGREDEYATLGQLDRIERRVRGPVARLELTGGHHPHDEHPDRVVAAIAALARETA